MESAQDEHSTHRLRQQSYMNGRRPSDEGPMPNNSHKPELSGRGGKTSWNNVNRDYLPAFLRDNEFLINEHRPELGTVIDCCRSIFMIHTETLNIWTHLLGCIGCVMLAAYYLLFVSNDSLGSLAFAAFFAGAIFCLGASTSFHVLTCHSEFVCTYMAKVDYCGVVTLIVASFMPWVYFGFYCNPASTKLVYIVGIIALGAVCVYVVMQDRFRQPQYRTLRAGLFIGLGLTGTAPGVHYIMTDGQTVGYHEWLLFMAALYIAGGVIYAMRVPERLSPGNFDICCQSHQILHVCVLGGILACYHGASQLALHRKIHQCPSL